MKHGFLLVCAFLLMSCTERPDVRQLACAPVEGVEQVLPAPGVFIGDMHGTVESPAFLSALACHVVQSGRPLVVAMEYDAEDQAVLDQFLGTADDGAAAYWIVFGGNVHARKTRGLPFINAPPGSEDHEPLGYLIRDWGLVHLDAAYRGGSNWECTGPSPDDCSVRESGTACTTDCPPHPVIRLQRSHPSYDGVYDVGKLTVSRPLHWR